MKRLHLTKLAALAAAVLAVTASAAAPAAAAHTRSVTLCSAEAVGSSVTVDTLTASGNVGGAGGTGAGAGGAGLAGDTPNEGMNGVLNDVLPGEDGPGTADDAVGGNTPADDIAGNPSSGEASGSGNTAGSGNNTGNTVGETITGNENAGNGKLEEGQAGGDENGIVGEGTDDNLVEDMTDSGTADANAAADETTAAETGTNWGSVIVALVIGVALVVVIVALIPRKRTD